MPALLRQSGNPRLLVICDSLDLPTGSCRLKRRGSSSEGGSGGGSKGGSGSGHKGLASIVSVLGHGDFMRLYLGVGHPGSREEVVAYVLGEPAQEELPGLAAAVKRAAEAVLLLVTEPPERVMHAINQKKQL